MENQLDPSIVALAKAIGLTESQGNYKAVGKSKEYGAYQYTPETWAGDSQKYLGQAVPLEASTPEQQDKVAYMKIQELGKQGYKPAQIASIWNSGKPEWEGNIGTNKYGVKYDTPAYVQKVSKNYESQKSGYNPTPYSNPSEGAPGQFNLTGATPEAKPLVQDESLGGHLSGRVNDVSTAVSDFTSKKQGLLSTGIQTVGAIAGGLGDVVNKGLEMIPGVKKVEELIGKGIGSLFKTPTGQAVAKSIGEFSQTHPELSKDIGAGFNIITAIPILKGLGAIKEVALDSVGVALKKVAEKSAMNDLTDVINRTIGGRNAAKLTPDAVKTLVTERAIPDIIDNRYITKEPYERLANEISFIEENELQPTIAKVSTKNVADRQSLDELQKEATNLIRQEMKGTGESDAAIAEVNRKFSSFKNDYGDFVTLQDINDMKRGVRTSVNFASPKLQSDVTYHLGQVFQKNIEHWATKLGLGNVHAINQKMARLIQAQNLLKHIEGKPIKTGLVGGLLKDVSTVGGEMAGNATGIPLAGAYIGREAGGRVGKKLVGIKKGILDRTDKNAKKTDIPKSAKKVGGLIAGTTAQKETR